MSNAQRMPVERRLLNYRTQPVPDRRRTAVFKLTEKLTFRVTPAQRRRLVKK